MPNVHGSSVFVRSRDLYFQLVKGPATFDPAAHKTTTVFGGARFTPLVLHRGICILDTHKR